MTVVTNPEAQASAREAAARASVAERILISLSRDPRDDDYPASLERWTLDNALSLLSRQFPDFERAVSGQRVMDFGCGTGFQAAALALKQDCHVVGLDTNRKTLGQAIDLAMSHRVPEATLSFVDHLDDSLKGTFDVVVSQNSFEHFADPIQALDEMKTLVKESGRVFITFAPPWLAPYGGHMHFFCRVPWVHLIFPESTVMNVRSRYRKDGAKRYVEIESGLNRMTVGRFERIVAASGLRVEFKRFGCVKNMTLLGKIPHVREFFINSVSVVLRKTV